MARMFRLQGIHSYSVKKVKGHDCTLVEEVDSVCKFIKSGCCIPLRRRIKKFTMIDWEHPSARWYIKSNCRMDTESNRHLERHYYMIHPLSLASFYRDGIMALVYIMLLVVTPVHCMIHENTGTTDNLTAKLITGLNAIAAINIVLCFLFGYHEHQSAKVVLSRQRVAYKYLTTYFIPDLLATIHFNQLGVVSGWYEPHIYFKFVWMFRLFRLFTINDFLEMFRIKLRLARYKFLVIKSLIIFLIIFVWAIFLLFMMDLIRKEGRQEDDLLRVATILAGEFMGTLFLIATPCRLQKTNLDLLTFSIILHIGKFFEIFIIAQIVQIYNCYTVATNSYESLINQMAAFIKIKEIPQRITRRIESYVNFKYQKRVYNEKLILDSLSSTLRKDVLWHTCQNLITKVETFKDLPPAIMLKVVTMLKQEIYLPNDVIVSAGDIGSEMFFIYIGVLAVFTVTGKEICHLSDGAHFGEIALLLNETRVASVVAIDFCELYRLTKKDFHEAIALYPAVKEKILNSATIRLKDTRSIVKDNDIVE